MADSFTANAWDIGFDIFMAEVDKELMHLVGLDHGALADYPWRDFYDVGCYAGMVYDSVEECLVSYNDFPESVMDRFRGNA